MHIGLVQHWLNACQLIKIRIQQRCVLSRAHNCSLSQGGQRDGKVPMLSGSMMMV